MPIDDSDDDLPLHLAMRSTLAASVDSDSRARLLRLLRPETETETALPAERAEEVTSLVPLLIGSRPPYDDWDGPEAA